MKELKSIPPNHRPVETEDGSWTLFSEQFDEACHSTSGAKSETILHYVNGCDILNRINRFSPFMILEVGFGLGVGFLTTLEKIPKGHPWVFVSMELDRDLLEWFRSNHPELSLHWEGNILKGEGENFKLFIIQGDARVAVPEFMKNHPMKFHAIYQDAFSPRRNPVLWTKEWFSFLKSISHEEVVLSTYSASTSIRKSLHETGWGVQMGDKFGPKRASTRARLNKETDAEILLQMSRSPVPALTDLQIPEFQSRMKK